MRRDFASASLRRGVRVFLALAIVAFWAAMMRELVRRQLALGDLDLYRRGAINFLGDSNVGERWMGIYRGPRRIGYHGFTLERLYEADAVRHRMSIESRVAMEPAAGEAADGAPAGLAAAWGALAKGASFSLAGDAELDHELVPERLELRLGWKGGRVELRGRREADKLILRVESGGQTLFELPPMPLQALCFSNGMALDLQLAELEVGKSYEVPVLDPITQTHGLARVEVLERCQTRLGGLPLDAFRLRTRFGPLSYESLVSPEGEILRQEIPALGITLVREAKADARRGFADASADAEAGAKAPQPPTPGAQPGAAPDPRKR